MHTNKCEIIEHAGGQTKVVIYTEVDATGPGIITCKIMRPCFIFQARIADVYYFSHALRTMDSAKSRTQ